MKNKFKTSFKKVATNSRICLKYIKSAKTGKLYFFYKIVQSLSNIIFPLIYITVPGVIINYLVQEKIAINMVIIFGLIIVLSPMIQYFLNLFTRHQIAKIKQVIGLELAIKFYKHCFKLDYETYENSEIQVLKSRSAEALANIWRVSDILFGFISQIISLITIATVIVVVNPILIFIIICFTIIVSVLKNKTNKKLFNLDKKCSMLDRKLWGPTYMIENVEYGKEIRLFKIEDFLLNEYESVSKESIDLNMKYIKAIDKPNTVNALLTMIEKIIIYAYLIFKIIYDKLLIGNFTIYLSYYENFKTNLTHLFNSHTELSRISLNIDELNSFMEYPTAIYSSGSKSVDFKTNSKIEFKNVSFKYPGSDNYALTNVSIKINFCEKICIVGDNGAGKTTFIKLLTRLYVPTEGEILLNGVNISDYNYNEYLSLFSPVFQDFVKYYMSIGKNIALEENIDYEKLDAVVKKSGLKNLIDRLPKKYDTQVDKWIDPEGIEPSGGENQRIAIARALYHSGEIYILDEPTAALDPDAEYEIYNQFNDMVNNKTALFITHRLSAAQLADIVVVFDKGRIVERGTHKKLIELNGKYKDMFEKQSKFYQNSK